MIILRLHGPIELVSEMRAIIKLFTISYKFLYRIPTQVVMLVVSTSITSTV